MSDVKQGSIFYTRMSCGGWARCYATAVYGVYGDDVHGYEISSGGAVTLSRRKVSCVAVDDFFDPTDVVAGGRAAVHIDGRFYPGVVGAVGDRSFSVDFDQPSDVDSGVFRKSEVFAIRAEGPLSMPDPATMKRPIPCDAEADLEVRLADIELFTISPGEAVELEKAYAEAIEGGLPVDLMEEVRSVAQQPTILPGDRVQEAYGDEPRRGTVVAQCAEPGYVDVVWDGVEWTGGPALKPASRLVENLEVYGNPSLLTPSMRACRIQMALQALRRPPHPSWMTPSWGDQSPNVSPARVGWTAPIGWDHLEHADGGRQTVCTGGLWEEVDNSFPDAPPSEQSIVRLERIIEDCS